MAEEKRILVVAHRTASTPVLLSEIRRRAREDNASFELLIPDVTDRSECESTLELALPLLQEAAGKPVEAHVAGPEPLESVRKQLASGRYDEVIISTLPRSVSRWLGRNLPRAVSDLGLPVTLVTAAGRGERAATAGIGVPGVPGHSR